jgi:hypothetical protein
VGAHNNTGATCSAAVGVALPYSAAGNGCAPHPEKTSQPTSAKGLYEASLLCSRYVGKWISSQASSGAKQCPSFGMLVLSDDAVSVLWNAVGLSNDAVSVLWNAVGLPCRVRLWSARSLSQRSFMMTTMWSMANIRIPRRVSSSPSIANCRCDLVSG